MEGIIEYNEFLRQRFEQTGKTEDLLKYVISETLSPLEDHVNAVKIIRENKSRHKNSTLFIIGAYLVIDWTWDGAENDLLNDLTEMQDQLSEQELAIMHYLMAEQLTKGQRCPPDSAYQHLLKSMQYKGPFVNNRLLCAGYFSPRGRIKMVDTRMLREALENVVEVHDQTAIERMTKEYFVEPQNFINEHILGTHISDSWYEILKEDLSEAENKKVLI